MKKWLLLIGLAFLVNLVLLLVVILFLPQVKGGFGVLWAAIILTAGTLLVKPALSTFLTKKGTELQPRAAWLRGNTLIYLVEFITTFVIFLICVLLSSVQVTDIWGWIFGTVILYSGTLTYHLFEGRIRAYASTAYDRAAGSLGKPKS
jgi:hypothetical protein